MLSSSYGGQNTQKYNKHIRLFNELTRISYVTPPFFLFIMSDVPHVRTDPISIRTN